MTAPAGPAEPSPPVVTLDKVSFAYDRQLILKDVDLVIHDGEMLCMIGPNGGGKTTLLRLILGLLKPTRGRLRVFDRRPDQASHLIGYVPQYTSFDLKFPVNVMDVVLMGRLGTRLAGPYRPADREAAHAALAEVGLGDLGHRPFADLSGGQRQRVLIARALASQPRLLLLDEPTSNVDSLAEQKLYDLLHHLNRHLTVLLVSHDLGVVSQMVTHVVCVHQEVQIHPTSALTGTAIRDMYGGNVSLVRHDHNCAVEGHRHD
jgi:zinc transport system ATP-binding protein